MIGFYQSELRRFISACSGLEKDDRPKVDEFINTDTTKISWNRGLKSDFIKEKKLEYKPLSVVTALYRPFIKQWAYFDKDFNDMIYQMPRLFPTTNIKNLAIMVCGKGSRNGFSLFMSNLLVDLNNLEAGTQCFPLYLYKKTETKQTGTTDLFTNTDNQPSTDGYTRKDAISDEGLAHFKKAYPSESFSKEDMFYYIYGLLHSPEYRERYADNLTKELPRIPCVKTAKDFWAYSKAGRDLAELHINYET